MFDITKILASIRITPTVAGAVFLFTAGMLFLPDRALAWVSALPLRAQYGPWFGGALLLSLAVLIAYAVPPVYKFARDQVANWATVRRGRTYLASLTPAERTILRGFISKNTRTQQLSFEDGVVKGLQAVGVLIRASQILSGPSLHTAYNLQPWAWSWLKMHPELVADDRDT